MSTRGAFSMLSPDQYQTLVRVPNSRVLLASWEEMDEHLSFGVDEVGLMDKAWWGLFCILPDHLISSDRVAGLGKPESFGTQEIYWETLHGAFSILNPTRIPFIASSLTTLDPSIYRTRYFALKEPIPKPKGLRGLFSRTTSHWYAEHVDEEDFDYVMAYALDAGRFFSEAAEKGQAVMFDGSI